MAAQQSVLCALLTCVVQLPEDSGAGKTSCGGAGAPRIVTFTSTHLMAAPRELHDVFFQGKQIFGTHGRILTWALSSTNSLRLFFQRTF